MSRIVPARNSRNKIKRPRKVVHHLALTFIAPLRAHHDDRFHSVNLLSRTGTPACSLFLLPGHTSSSQRSLHLYCGGILRERTGSNRKLAPPSTQAAFGWLDAGHVEQMCLYLLNFAKRKHETK